MRMKALYRLTMYLEGETFVCILHLYPTNEVSRGEGSSQEDAIQRALAGIQEEYTVTLLKSLFK